MTLGLRNRVGRVAARARGRLVWTLLHVGTLEQGGRRRDHRGLAISTRVVGRWCVLPNSERHEPCVVCLALFRVLVDPPGHRSSNCILVNLFGCRLAGCPAVSQGCCCIGHSCKVRSKTGWLRVFTACHARCVATAETGDPMGVYCGGARWGRRVSGCTIGVGCGWGGRGIAVAVVGNREVAKYLRVLRRLPLKYVLHMRVQRIPLARFW